MNPRVGLIGILAMLSLLLAVPSGCTQGTETGNPDVAQLSLRLTSSEPQRVALGTQATATELTVSTVRLAFESLAFLDCSEEVEQVVSSETLSFVDSEPLIVAAGTYCRVDISFLNTGEEGSLQLDGTLSDGSSLSVRASVPEPLLLVPNHVPTSALESISVEAGAQLLLVADVAQMFTEGALSDVNEGPVTISENENAWVLESLFAGLMMSVELHRDSDGDGLVDPESVPLMVSLSSLEQSAPE